LNILIAGVGVRTKLVKYFKNHFNKVVVTDCSILAPALYFADKYHIVPHINSPDYLEAIKDICLKEEINGILSLIDPEQRFLSEKEKYFEEIGVRVVGSSKKVCDLCFDKWKMHQFLRENNFKTAKSYIDLSSFMKDYLNNEVSFPVFVKPITGSGSVGAQKISDQRFLEFIFNSQKGLMIQSFIEGQEYSVDVYTDANSKEVISIFTKKKISMRAGESDKAVSFKDEKLFALVKEVIKKLGASGPIDLDVFESNGEFYILEVNPRFGGSYPHAYECGENFPEMILKNLKGETLTTNIGGYKSNIYMLKHYEIKVISE